MSPSPFLRVPPLTTFLRSHSPWPGLQDGPRQPGPEHRPGPHTVAAGCGPGRVSQSRVHPKFNHHVWGDSSASTQTELP
eukprot:451489-Hanusia_phi.AAC.1